MEKLAGDRLPPIWLAMQNALSIRAEIPRTVTPGKSALWKPPYSALQWEHHSDGLSLKNSSYYNHLYPGSKRSIFAFLSSPPLPFPPSSCAPNILLIRIETRCFDIPIPWLGNEKRSSRYASKSCSGQEWKFSSLANRTASTVLRSVIKHAGSDEARKKCREKREPQSKA